MNHELELYVQGDSRTKVGQVEMLQNRVHRYAEITHRQGQRMLWIR